jgi:hypothetical protein
MYGQVLANKNNDHRPDGDTRAKDIFFTVKFVNRDFEQWHAVKFVNLKCKHHQHYPLSITVV